MQSEAVESCNTTGYNNANMSQVGKSSEPLPETDQKDGCDGDKKGTINKPKDQQLLCSSCDNCRSKKTKCNGERPCEACVLSYIRKNKIANVDEVDMKKITCVYSPAKKRGPPPKRATGESRDSEEGREQERKQRRKEDNPRRVPEEVPSVPNPNLESASVLNILGALLNPAAAASSMRPIPPPPPTIDSAALQQILLSTLGTANTGYNNIMNNNAPSAASQLYLQHLQQQMQLQQLQQNLQQQLQQQVTALQGQTTRGAESSLSSPSPEEENKTQALQNEVERLRGRVDELETENADLKQKLDALVPSKEE